MSCVWAISWTPQAPRLFFAPASPRIHDAPLESRQRQKVGIVGLGGLGHMGVKFAHAFGAHVVLFTTSPGKTADALRLGADEVVISKKRRRDGKACGQL